MQIKEEIQKLLIVGFIKPIQSPTSLANIVPVKKMDKLGAVLTFLTLIKHVLRMSSHYQTLTCWSMSSGHTMFSFINSFNGYNQIKMDSGDTTKTIFRTLIGNFHYTAMPF